jgi:2-polyprenyl-6-hydroxyphenyl methylase / 3-demethylubiquinone-9 3-methyltransferase
MMGNLWTGTSDPAEIEKFNSLASRWWDTKGPFRPLHDLNPLRLDYIERHATVKGRRVVDVGCGGGILSESMARAGAEVLGIDLAGDVLRVAELHALEAKLPIRYRQVDVAELAEAESGQYDIVTAMEMLEHVPEPDQTLTALAKLLRPDGRLFVSTINRTPKAFALAIVGAEWLLRMLPVGTHSYENFIRPSELARWARAAGLELEDLAGVAYHPLTRSFSIADDVSVNYMAVLRCAS